MSRRARSAGGCRGVGVPGREGLPTHDHVTQMRPLVYDGVGTSRRTHTARRSTSRCQRNPDHRATGARVDHRGRVKDLLSAPGRPCGPRRSSLDGPRASHLPPPDPNSDFHVGYTVSTSGNLEPARGDAQARAVAAAHPAPRSDPETEGAGEALGRRGPHSQGQWRTGVSPGSRPCQARGSSGSARACGEQERMVRRENG